MQTRVTFQFPSDMEVRYLERRPRRGDPIRGRRHELFFISRIETDDVGCLAVCVTPVEYARDTKGLSRKARALARELRERAVQVRRRSRELRPKAPE